LILTSDEMEKDNSKVHTLWNVGYF
jgi:hypothetical protein